MRRLLGRSALEILEADDPPVIDATGAALVSLNRLPGTTYPAEDVIGYASQKPLFWCLDEESVYIRDTQDKVLARADLKSPLGNAWPAFTQGDDRSVALITTETSQIIAEFDRRGDSSIIQTCEINLTATPSIPFISLVGDWIEVRDSFGPGDGNPAALVGLPSSEAPGIMALGEDLLAARSTVDGIIFVRHHKRSLQVTRSTSGHLEIVATASLDSSVATVAICPDGAAIAVEVSGSNMDSLDIYDVIAGQLSLRTSIPVKGLTNRHFMPNGDLILVQENGPTLHVKNSSADASPLIGWQASSLQPDYGNQDRVFLVDRYNAAAAMVQVKDRTLHVDTIQSETNHTFLRFASSPSGDWLVVTPALQQTRAAVLFSYAKNQAGSFGLAQRIDGTRSTVLDFSIDNNGRLLAGGRMLKESVETWLGHRDEVTAIVPVGSSECLSASRDGQVLLWKQQRSKILAAFDDEVIGLTVAQTGGIVAVTRRTGGSDVYVLTREAVAEAHLSITQLSTEPIYIGPWVNACEVVIIESTGMVQVLDTVNATVKQIEPIGIDIDYLSASADGGSVAWISSDGRVGTVAVG